MVVFMFRQFPRPNSEKHNKNRIVNMPVIWIVGLFPCITSIQMTFFLRGITHCETRSVRVCPNPCCHQLSRPLALAPAARCLGRHRVDLLMRTRERKERLSEKGLADDVEPGDWGNLWYTNSLLLKMNHRNS